MNFQDIFYRKPYNKTLWIISSVYVVLALLFERERYFNNASFYLITLVKQKFRYIFQSLFDFANFKPLFIVLGSQTQFVQLCTKFWVKWNITLGFQCTGLLQTCTVKRVKTKLGTENAFNWDHFGFGGCNKLECDERTLFWVTLQNLDLYFKHKNTFKWFKNNLNLFNYCFFETLSETLGFVLFIAWVVKGS